MKNFVVDVVAELLFRLVVWVLDRLPPEAWPLILQWLGLG